MCRTYRPKGKPTYTRLCHRYREQMGQHVAGEWECGQYPRPRRRGASKKEDPNVKCCACGAAAARGHNVCPSCYVQEQVDRLPEEARAFLKEES